MAQIILSGDGMTIEIEDEIARSDELLKRALSPHYPDLANALITREEKDGVLRVTVAKRAGPKGSAMDETTPAHPVYLRMISMLKAASEYLNPALALAWQLGHLQTQEKIGGEGDTRPGITLEQQLALQPLISEAILEGESQAAEVEKVLQRLKVASAVPARKVPGGF